MKDIEENMDLPWVWAMISKNPNITEEFIDKYKHLLDFSLLSQNKFALYNRLTGERFQEHGQQKRKRRYSSDRVKRGRVNYIE